MGVEGLHAGLQAVEVGRQMLNLVMVDLNAVAHVLDVGAGHHIGAVLDLVGNQAVVDLSGHAILHGVTNVGVEGLHAGLQGAELGLDGLDVGVVGLDAVAHSLDVGTGHHVGAVLDLIGGEMVLNQGINGDVSG